MGHEPRNIAELENILDRLLPRPRLDGRPGGALLGAAEAWSRAVWAAAERSGPRVPTPGQRDAAWRLGRRPVFICGAHRSGTTLVRDLLDGHPALLVLPSEGSFHTDLQARLARLPPEERPGHMGREWLRRLANPINQPPYWLLGRSGGEVSPYLEFARAFLGWWPVVREHFGGTPASWPLLAVVFAYASCGTGDRPGLEADRWAEKTPMNERFLHTLWREYPEARAVHVVRDPVAVFASRKRLEQRTGGTFAPATTLRRLAASYRIALRQAERSEARHLLLCYEDLCEMPEETTKTLAAFLGIEWRPDLLRPTVAGRPARANSSFREAPAPGRILRPGGQAREESLTGHERELVAAAVGDAARALGYQPPLAGVWRARYLRVRHRLR